MPRAVNGLKQCARCKETKFVAEYFRNAASSDGYFPYCKTCRKVQKDEGREKSHIARRKLYRRRAAHFIAQSVAWAKEARRKDPEKHRAYHRAYYAEWHKRNPDKQREYQLRWYAKDPQNARDIALASYHKHYEKNREALQHRSSENCARRRNGFIVCDLTLPEWRQLLEDADYCCTYCGNSLDAFWPPEKDHKIPVARGGQHTKDNITPACKSCNSSKKDKTQDEYFEYLQKISCAATAASV